MINFSISNNFMIFLSFAFPGSGAHRHLSMSQTVFRGGPAVPLSRKKATLTRWKLPILPLSFWGDQTPELPYQLEIISLFFFLKTNVELHHEIVVYSYEILGY